MNDSAGLPQRTRPVRFPRGAVGGALALLLLVRCSESGEPAGAAIDEPAVTKAPGDRPVVGAAPQAAAVPVRDDGEPWPADPPPFPNERFTWMRDALAGWCHVSSESGEYRLPEVMCGGVVLFDADGDGDLDLFLANGGTWNDLTPGAKFPGHAFFLNDGGLKFRNVAREAGVFGVDGSYCMGGTAADYDGDGDQDLYVTAYSGESTPPGNYLYRNDGVKEGIPRFTECAADAGVRGSGRWSASACFFDPDGDGRLDLYVDNYVEFTYEANRKLQCGAQLTGIWDYCAPKVFMGLQDYFFRNEGNGRFRECALEVGLEAPGPLSDNAKGLGVVASDVDADGDCDLFVTNDGCPNFLFVNDGHGKFREDGTVRGCAYDEDGKSRAGMGVDAGDFDGDGDVDLWVVNLDVEMNGLYRNDGRGFFSDDHQPAGLTLIDRGQVGFGTDFFDFDNDGDLDIAIANGHVLVNVHKTRGTLFYRQADQLLENDGVGRFRLVPPQEAGAYFLVRNAARGLATGDLDGDGDLDLVIVPRDEPAVLLRNNHVQAAQRVDALLLTLRMAAGGNRDAIGARVRVTAGGRTQVEEVRAGNSYCSCSDRRLHFGLGAAKAAEKVEVRWPVGKSETFGPLDAGFEYLLTQGGVASKIRELRP